MSHYKEIDLTNVNRILVCILKYHGDVLLSSPVFTALKKAKPEATIDAYLFKDTIPMLSGHPAISELIAYDQKWRKLPFLRRIKKEIGRWIEVRRRKYDLVINLTSGDRGALIAKFSKAPIRIGCVSGGGLYKKDLIYTTVVSKTKTPRHIIERNLDLVRAVGINPTEKERDLYFHVPEGAYARVDEIKPKEPFVVIHPTSRCDYKHWPAEYYLPVIEYFLQKGLSVVISGGPGEEEKAFINGIVTKCPGKGVYNFQGKLSLKELGALIDRAKMLLTVDSVPSHIASALKKPTVVIFGPSDDIKWGPWRNPKARAVRLDVPCKRCDQEGCGGTWMSDCLIKLPPKRIIAEIDQLLGDAALLQMGSFIVF